MLMDNSQEAQFGMNVFDIQTNGYQRRGAIYQAKQQSTEELIEEPEIIIETEQSVKMPKATDPKK